MSYFYEHRNEQGMLHCIDGPAREWTENKEWWVEGKKHRLDDPAVEWAGSKEWWVNGERHRLDGPAIEWADGDKEWWVEGKFHRLDGPAREWADGDKEWWVNGERHRLDGPAVEWADGDKEWWVEGIELPREQFRKIVFEKKEHENIRIGDIFFCKVVIDNLAYKGIVKEVNESAVVLHDISNKSDEEVSLSRLGFFYERVG